MCVEGETVIINGGTTTFMMTEFLADKRLKILTNSFPMAARLLVSSENEITLPGRHRVPRTERHPLPLRQRHHPAPLRQQDVHQRHGLSLLGLIEADPLMVQAEKRLINQAEELVVLADSSKFARKAGLILCGLDRVSCVITDTGASDKAVQTLEQYGVKVVTVEADAAAPDLQAAVRNRAARMTGRRRPLQQGFPDPRRYIRFANIRKLQACARARCGRVA
jgi:DeoR family ulaG and ulaABCDEF operon transcriptional repressor